MFLQGLKIKLTEIIFEEALAARFRGTVSSSGELGREIESRHGGSF
jgi:hypothetical protein